MSPSTSPPSGAPDTVIRYGPGLPDETELRLCGSVGAGTRALELGISNEMNSLAFAALGGRAVAVDPDPQRIERLRSAAAARELSIQCQQTDHADLGFATSGSVDLVLANRTIGTVEDIGRLLRQVHRLLKPDGPFVVTLEHPFARLVSQLSRAEPAPAYGQHERTIEAWYTALTRSNFTIDTMHELASGTHTVAPSTLILRARKQGS